VENFESWALDYIISEKAENKHIDDYISKISLQFVEIYQESSEAERLNLLYVCGAGYRKALEVLVKDYAISIKPDDKDDIENKLTLVTCIEKYLSTPKLKEIARRASWLGNDEVHYKKKWGEEVTKLRGAINLVVHFILQEKEANNLLEEMTKPKK